MDRRYRLIGVTYRDHGYGQACELVFESTDEYDVRTLAFPGEITQLLKDSWDLATYTIEELEAMAARRQQDQLQ